jgi:hypothetical protein
MIQRILAHIFQMKHKHPLLVHIVEHLSPRIQYHVDDGEGGQDDNKLPKRILAEAMCER